MPSKSTIAYGTGTRWFKRNADNPLDTDLIDSVKLAVKTGFKHIDCAEVYGNEVEVGIALRDTPRESLFITSKLLASIKDPIAAAKRSIEKLNCKYLDLYLIHAPFFNLESHGIEIEQAWPLMESLVTQGIVKEIGVSNFRIKDLKRILAICKIKPAVNQIEFHPYLQSELLVLFCKENGILVSAVSAALT